MPFSFHLLSSYISAQIRRNLRYFIVQNCRKSFQKDAFIRTPKAQNETNRSFSIQERSRRVKILIRNRIQILPNNGVGFTSSAKLKVLNVSPSLASRCKVYSHGVTIRILGLGLQWLGHSRRCLLMANYMYMDQGDNNPPQILVTAEDKDSRKLKDNDERFKKGEWSNGAIFDLLDAYEAKWNNRNRGNLRVGDWEDVSAQVTSRNGGLKAGKTPTQCKNKIEGMKKRYRSEALESCSNNGENCSAWPFFYRMDLMLRCPTRKAGIPGGMDAGCQSGVDDAIPLVEDGEGSEVRRDIDFVCEHSPVENLGKSLLVLQQHFERDQTLDILPQQFETERVERPSAPESDTSPLPVIKIDDNGNNTGGAGSGKAKLRRKIHNDVAVNIRSFADSILRLEQAKMEMYKDTERLRAEAETRRAELELKRTEIIMGTQLQIAKLLSSKTRKRKANNASQATERSNVVVDEVCVSEIQVAGQPEVQSLHPGNVLLSPEPSPM